MSLFPDLLQITSNLSAQPPFHSLRNTYFLSVYWFRTIARSDCKVKFRIKGGTNETVNLVFFIFTKSI